MSKEEDLKKTEKQAYRSAVLLFSLLFGLIIIGPIMYYTIKPVIFDSRPKPRAIESLPVEADADRIKNGIHLRTGLIDAEGLMTVVNNCTHCHSSRIIIQNRMNTEGWNATIKWMQETQNLWDLGDNQEIIVNYLVTNYPVKKKGRRENLSNIEWYELEN